MERAKAAGQRARQKRGMRWRGQRGKGLDRSEACAGGGSRDNRAGEQQRGVCLTSVRRRRLGSAKNEELAAKRPEEEKPRPFPTTARMPAAASIVHLRLPDTYHLQPSHTSLSASTLKQQQNAVSLHSRRRNSPFPWFSLPRVH